MTFHLSRNEMMARIRSRGNKRTEVALATILRIAGITGWRRQVCIRFSGKVNLTSGLVRPDFVFQREKLAVFVDGCFWHMCRYHCSMPTKRRAYWRAKLSRNRTRDKFVNSRLRQSGWKVVRVWEHELAKPSKVVERIAGALQLRV